MEFVSCTLKPRQLNDELVWIVGLLKNRGFEDLVIQYGWGCKLPIYELSMDRDVKTDDLLAFVREAQARGVYTTRASDLFLSDRSKIITFNLCHESDVHVTSDDSAIIGLVQERWRAMDIERLSESICKE